MRPKLRQYARAMAFFSISLVMVVVFQNCGGFNSDYNPLYDRNTPSVCVGISCSKDLTMMELGVRNELPLVVSKSATGTPSATCDTTSCIDISGYCETAGYSLSKITYQWRLNGSLIGSPMPNSGNPPECDDNGRFQIQARVPSGYDYNNIYSIVVTLKVMDDAGNVFENPVGTHRRELTVVNR